MASSQTDGATATTISFRPLTAREWAIHDAIVAAAHPDVNRIKLPTRPQSLGVWRRSYTPLDMASEIHVTQDRAGNVLSRTRVVEELSEFPVGWNGVQDVDVPAATKFLIHVAQLHDSSDTGPTRQEVSYNGNVLLIRAFGFSNTLWLHELMTLQPPDEQCYDVSYDPYAMPSDYVPNGQRINTPPGAVAISMRLGVDADDDDDDGHNSRAGPRVKRTLNPETGALVVHQPPPPSGSFGALLGSVRSYFSSGSNFVRTLVTPMAAAPLTTTHRANGTRCAFSNPLEKIGGWSLVSDVDCPQVNAAMFAATEVLFPIPGQVPSEMRVTAQREAGNYTLYIFGIVTPITIRHMVRIQSIPGVTRVGYAPRMRSEMASTFSSATTAAAAAAAVPHTAPKISVSPGALCLKLLSNDAYAASRVEQINAEMMETSAAPPPPRPAPKRSAASAAVAAADPLPLTLGMKRAAPGE